MTPTFPPLITLFTMPREDLKALNDAVERDMAASGMTYETLATGVKTDIRTDTLGRHQLSVLYAYRHPNPKMFADRTAPEIFAVEIANITAQALSPISYHPRAWVEASVNGSGYDAVLCMNVTAEREVKVDQWISADAINDWRARLAAADSMAAQMAEAMRDDLARGEASDAPMHPE